MTKTKDPMVVKCYKTPEKSYLKLKRFVKRYQYPSPGYIIRVAIEKFMDENSGVNFNDENQSK